MGKSGSDFVLKYEESGNKNGETMVFVHGWPDSPRIWDNQVKHFQKDYRCIAICFPNCGGKTDLTFGMDFDILAEKVKDVIVKVSPNNRIILVGHDWGSFVSYTVEQQYPELISKLITLDVAAQMKPNFRESIFILAYQGYVTFCFLIGLFPILGPIIGNFLVRKIAVYFRAPQGAETLASMGYFYLYAYIRLFTKNPAYRRYESKCPHLFVHNTRGPVKFWSQRFCDKLNARDNCRSIGVRSSHWLQKTYKGLNDDIQTWLDELNKKSKM